MSRLNPYISFRDTAEEAMNFYQSVFGGELQVNRFGELPDSGDPADENKILHSQLETPTGFTLMASDTPSDMEFESPAGFSISVDGDNESELAGYFDALSDGGTVVMPLDEAPWGGKFGQCTDRFGIGWMVSVNSAD